MALETVFLDAGGVFIYPNWWRVSDALARHGVSVSPEALKAADPHARRELDDHKVVGGDDRREPRLAVLRSDPRARGRHALGRDDRGAAELHTYHTASNLWEYVPDDVLPALDALRARGLQLVVVSNANGTLRAHLARIGLDRYASTWCWIPRTRGREARSALLRDRARAKRRAQGDTIHVGDLYYVDVVGARNAGLRGVLLDEANLRPDADCPRVQSLEELVARIGDGEFD